MDEITSFGVLSGRHECERKRKEMLNRQKETKMNKGQHARSRLPVRLDSVSFQATPLPSPHMVRPDQASLGARAGVYSNVKMKKIRWQEPARAHRGLHISSIRLALSTLRLAFAFVFVFVFTFALTLCLAFHTATRQLRVSVSTQQKSVATCSFRKPPNETAGSIL